jgi:hypothetical protein
LATPQWFKITNNDLAKIPGLKFETTGQAKKPPYIPIFFLVFGNSFLKKINYSTTHSDADLDIEPHRILTESESEPYRELFLAPAPSPYGASVNMYKYKTVSY